jgi:hypothetical protein
LHSDTKLFLLSYPPNPKIIQEVLENTNSDVFVFRSSQQLQFAIENTGHKLETVFPEGQLCQIHR